MGGGDGGVGPTAHLRAGSTASFVATPSAHIERRLQRAGLLAGGGLRARKPAPGFYEEKRCDLSCRCCLSQNTCPRLSWLERRWLERRDPHEPSQAA